MKSSKKISHQKNYTEKSLRYHWTHLKYAFEKRIKNINVDARMVLKKQNTKKKKPLKIFELSVQNKIKFSLKTPNSPAFKKVNT